MEIYERIFVIFSILTVQRACEVTSEKYEETKLEPAEERFVLDDNSTFPESEFFDNKYTMGKRSLETELGTKETTEDDVDISETEYFKKTTTQTINPAHSEPNLRTDESQPWEEGSDFEIETETFVNRKHQSRGLKDYKYKSKDGEGKNNHSERKVDSLNDEKGKHSVNLNLNIGWKKEAEDKKTFKPLEDFFTLEHLTVFKDEEDEPYKKVDVKKYFIAALRDMGIEHIHLLPENLKFIKRIYQIHNIFLDLIEKDIKSNIFPFLFYHTVAPVIRLKILPHLAKPNVMKVVKQLVKNYEIKKFLNILLDLTDLPKYKTKNANITIRLLTYYFASSKVENNVKNWKLVNKYEKNLKNLLEIIDHDWQEYEAPVSFINYVLMYSIEEPFIRRTQMLFKRIKDQKEKTVLPRYKGEFSKDEDSESWMKWIQWVWKIIGFGKSEQEL